MRLQFTLTGVSPIIMHNGAAGLDTRSPISREIAAIAAKKGGDRTDVDDLRLQELECQRSLYLDADGKPTLPGGSASGHDREQRPQGEAGPPGPRGAADRVGLVLLRRRAVRRDAREARQDDAVHGAGRGAAPSAFCGPGRSSTARGRWSAWPTSTRSWWTRRS